MASKKQEEVGCPVVELLNGKLDHAVVHRVLATRWDYAEWNGWSFLGWMKPVGLSEWAFWAVKRPSK